MEKSCLLVERERDEVGLKDCDALRFTDGWREGVPEPRSNPGKGPVDKALELGPGDVNVACCGGTE